MKIALILNSQFHILSVLQRNMDDAAAAVSFLAMQLTKLGHDVTIFSQIANNVEACGVRCRSLNIVNGALNMDKAILEPDFEVIIIKNDAPEFAVMLKNSIPYKPKIYLWTALNANSPVNKGLADPNIVNQLAGIICVSEWQRAQLLSGSRIPPEKVTVLYYAIAPFYEDLFIDGKEFQNLKSKAPYLAYVAAPEDGLEILLDKYPDVHGNYSNVMLSVFSDISETSENPKHKALYDAAKKTKGIQYIGKPDPLKLAVMLRSATIISYPSVIPATSYVALMEAMAAGLYPITSKAGAIVEYCFKFGKNVADENLQKDSLDSYVSTLLSICQTEAHSESAFFDYCYKQVIEINKKHTWRVRAREWIEYLTNH